MALTNSLILIFPNPNESYVLYMDASKHNWAGVLTEQKLTKVNGESVISFLPITYISGTFMGSQKNWSTLTKQVYAIYMSFRNCHTTYKMPRSLANVIMFPYAYSSLLIH